MINDIIKRLEGYIVILKEIKNKESEIVEVLSRQDQQDLYYHNITEVYNTVLKMDKRMNMLRQLKLFIKRR